MTTKQGDKLRTRVLLADSLRLFHEMGNKVAVVRGLLEFAGMVATQAQQRAELECAARLGGAAEALEDSMIARPEFGVFGDSAPRAPCAVLRTRLGESAFAAASAEGR